MIGFSRSSGMTAGSNGDTARILPVFLRTVVGHGSPAAWLVRRRAEDRMCGRLIVHTTDPDDEDGSWDPQACRRSDMMVFNVGEFFTARGNLRTDVPTERQ